MNSFWRSPIATIHDVARLAGVSSTTVSHVINRTRKVGTLTESRVRDAIETLHFVPSTLARGLRTRSTRTIGVIGDNVLNSFFAEVIAGIEELCFDQDFGVFFSFTERKERKELRILEDFNRRGVDGLILLSLQTDEELGRFVEETRIPLVLFQRSNPHWRCDSLCTDDRRGGGLAVDHLIALGHRRIAFIGGETEPSHSARLREVVYRERLTQLGCPPPESWIASANYTFEGGYAATLRILGAEPARPTAFLCISDRVALGCLAALRHSGISFPEEISVIGYDNLSWLEYGNPPLTSVDHQARDQGRRMAERILLRIRKPDLPFEVLAIEPFLRVRGTTAPVRAS